MEMIKASGILNVNFHQPTVELSTHGIYNELSKCKCFYSVI